MKRDPYLVRDLLRLIEDGQPLEETAAVHYHLEILEDAGLVAGRTLTWQGHELLELCRDGERFRQGVEEVRTRTGGVNFGLLQEWLATYQAERFRFLLRLFGGALVRHGVCPLPSRSRRAAQGGSGVPRQ
jgi:hypothetical protein